MKRSFLMVFASFFIVTGCSENMIRPQYASAQYAAGEPSARTLAESAAPPEEPGTQTSVAVSKTHGRVMIYNAVMFLVVEDIQRTIEAIRSEVESVAGYMQSMDAASITVKVPAGVLRKVISNIEKLGRVTRKEIKGQDVTEEVRDLQIRLSNAEMVRNRLVVLLERAVKVEDALKVERELGRITENIELLKGKLLSLENQVAFSTLTVRLNSPVPQHNLKEEVPFPWVRELAGDMQKGKVTDQYLRTDGRGVDFELPESFAKYHEADYLTRATSAEGVLLKVQRHKNMEGADLSFWKSLIKRSLAAKHSLTITHILKTRIQDDVQTEIIKGVKEIADKKIGYLVAITLNEDYVYTYEAWGPLQEFEKSEKNILKSIQSMDILGWFERLLRNKANEKDD